MSDYTTKEIGEARESSLSPVSKEIQGWLFSPQFLGILRITQIAGAIFTALEKKSLPKEPYAGRKEVYSDVSIFITALVMKVWKLSLGEITRRLKLYPELAVACGYQPSETISKSHLSRRLRRLGPLPFLLYFIYLVCQLMQAGRVL